MSSRPRTVTFVAGFFILYAVLTAVPRAWLLVDPEAYRLAVELTAARAAAGLVAVPFGWQLAHALAAVPVLLTAGVFMLRGHAWAVLLLAVWVVGSLLLTLLVVGWSTGFMVKLASGSALLALLARAPVRAWFARPG